MNETLTRGTVITVVGPRFCLATCVVSDSTDGRYYSPATSGRTYGRTYVDGYWFHVASPEGVPMNALHTSQEGVAWVRGHHHPDSRVVDACRVAQALQPKPEEPKPAMASMDRLLGQAALTLGRRLFSLVLANHTTVKK